MDLCNTDIFWGIVAVIVVGICVLVRAIAEILLMIVVLKGGSMARKERENGEE